MTVVLYLMLGLACFAALLGLTHVVSGAKASKKHG